MTQRVHELPFGAQVLDDGRVRFRLWAPSAREVALCLGPVGSMETMQLAPEADGWYGAITSLARHGTPYRYLIDGELEIPDPAARYQPGDPAGNSEVLDPRAYAWQDTDWKGRPWDEAVIYEIHTGAFTPEGNYAGIAQRLDYLAELGVSALELMPLADFPGRHGWGYDGVLPYAPDAAYGHPDTLKALIDAAHRRGLMVLLDVVYNHFGPEGNYLSAYAKDFFNPARHTPWGAAINYDGPGNRWVREFFIHNALYWLEEYHFDGLRLDAVHAIRDASSPDILEELADRVRTHFPGRAHIHLVLENDDNRARYLSRDAHGRSVYYNAQWNDDAHHVLHVLASGERDGYYADYADDPIRHLGRVLTEGFAYQGEASTFRDGAPRGEPSAHLPPTAFINFLQNHDQIGNRALGERLHRIAPADALRAATAVLLLSPSIPLLFMGDEWATPQPFLYFCDFCGELGEAVRTGRRNEFARFPAFSDPAARARIPDPTAEQTFRQSILDWSVLGQPSHADWLALYRELLSARHREIVPLLARLRCGRAVFDTLDTPAANALRARWPADDGTALLLYANFSARELTLPDAPSGRPLYVTPGASPASLPAWGVACYHAGPGA